MTDCTATAADVSVRELSETEFVRSLSDVESCDVITDRGQDYVEAKLDGEAVGFVN